MYQRERVPDLTGKDTFAVRITCGGTEPKHNVAAIRTVTLPEGCKKCWQLCIL